VQMMEVLVYDFTGQVEEPIVTTGAEALLRGSIKTFPFIEIVTPPLVGHNIVAAVCFGSCVHPDTFVTDGPSG